MEETKAKYMNIPQMAKYLGVSETHLRRLVREKLIPHVYLGRRVIFCIEKVDEWMSDQARRSTF